MEDLDLMDEIARYRERVDQLLDANNRLTEERRKIHEKLSVEMRRVDSLLSTLVWKDSIITSLQESLRQTIFRRITLENSVK